MLAEEHISKIIKDYKSHKELSVFLYKYYDWKKSFNVHQRWNVYEAGVKFLEKIGENELAYYEWKQLQIEEYGQSDQFTYRHQAILRLSFFEKSLNKGLVDSFHVHKIAFKGHQLTKFGLRNKGQIFNSLGYEYRKVNSQYNIDLTNKSYAHIRNNVVVNEGEITFDDKDGVVLVKFLIEGFNIWMVINTDINNEQVTWFSNTDNFIELTKFSDFIILKGS